MDPEHRPRFGDPIRINQITNPVEQKEHLHRLVQQLSKEEYLNLSEADLQTCEEHTKDCTKCDTKLRDFENSRIFD